MTRPLLPPGSRAAGIVALDDQHSQRGRRRHARRAWAKRAVWRLVVRGAVFTKRVIDIMAAVILMIVAAPIAIVVAIIIKLTDGGPVLFWQWRVGRHGKEFPFPKLRSMCLDAEAKKDALLQYNDHANGVTFKMKRDPRITWIGSKIRKLSIDELPQLWCVLIGDMSLVGPRPPVPREVALYSIAARRRLDVVPGLTCLWQVSGRGDVSFEEQVALDVRYIESQSVVLDVWLLFRTVPAVLLGRGAY